MKRWRWRRVILRGGGGDSREGRCQRGGTGINLGPAPWWEIRNREGSGWGLEFRSCKYRLECGATGHTPTNKTNKQTNAILKKKKRKAES